MKKSFHAKVLFLGLVLSFLFYPSETIQAIEIEAITKPSGDVMLSFSKGGKVQEVHVSEGDQVQKGQLLAGLENKIELYQLKQLELQAKNTARLESVKIEMAQKEQDVKKLEWAKERGAVTTWELDHTRLDLATARISLKQVRLELEMAKLQRDEMKAQIELLSIHSPIIGQIERVEIEPGESPQPLAPVIRVVKVDPLYIDVHVPLAEASKLSPGQTVMVKVESMGEGNAYEATIKHISAVADAASMTLRVELELKNPELRPAGERVIVLF